MTKPWTVNDEQRINAAAGTLSDAAALAYECAERGRCPLTKTQVQQALEMARSAAVLLERIKAADV